MRSFFWNNMLLDLMDDIIINEHKTPFDIYKIQHPQSLEIIPIEHTNHYMLKGYLYHNYIHCYLYNYPSYISIKLINGENGNDSLKILKTMIKQILSNEKIDPKIEVYDTVFNVIFNNLLNLSLTNNRYLISITNSFDLNKKFRYHLYTLYQFQMLLNTRGDEQHNHCINHLKEGYRNDIKSRLNRLNRFTCEDLSVEIIDYLC